MTKEPSERGNQYAIAALKHKRATLAGEIADFQNKIAWRQKQLEHVDATLQVFGYDSPQSIKNVRPLTRIHLFKQGQLCALVRDVLREGIEPMVLGDVTEGVRGKLGADAAAIHALRKRVLASLNYLYRKNDIEKIGKHVRVRWKLP